MITNSDEKVWFPTLEQVLLSLKAWALDDADREMA